MLLIAAFLAGFVRGLSGFGAAMVFMPIALNTVSIKQALVLLFMIGLPAQIPFVISAYKDCKFKEILPLAIGATIAVPIGVTIVLYLDKELVRNAISVLVLIFVALLASGWKYKHQLKTLHAILIGKLAGLAGGMAGLYGPILSLLWLGNAQNNSKNIRANLLIFFAIIAGVEAVTFGAKGMLEYQIVIQGLWLTLPYFLGMLIGSIAFKYTSEFVYRLITFCLCIFAAISNLFL